MIEINDEIQGTYNSNSSVKFKTSITRLSFSDYSDRYKHVKATITVPNTATASATVNNTNKKVIFENCTPFTNWIIKINNT